MGKTTKIFIVTIVLAIIAIILVFSSSSSTFRKELSNFAIKDTSNVTKIYMVNKNNKDVLLEKQEDQTWLVDQKYEASPQSIKMILTTMMEISPRGPVPKASHNNIVKTLASSSVKVEIYQVVPRINLFNRIKLFPHEKLTRTYYVGNSTQDNLGTFMLLEGSSVPFVVHILGFRGFVAPRYSVDVDDWRDHTIFNHELPEIEEITVEFPDKPLSSYKVKNVEDRSVALFPINGNSGPVPYDTLKMLRFITGFKDIRFESLLHKEETYVDSILSSTPLQTITLRSKAGETVKVKTFPRENVYGQFDVEGNPYEYDTDKMYASVNDNDELLLIQYFVFDRIIKPLEWFQKSGDGLTNTN